MSYAGGSYAEGTYADEFIGGSWPAKDSGYAGLTYADGTYADEIDDVAYEDWLPQFSIRIQAEGIYPIRKIPIIIDQPNIYPWIYPAKKLSPALIPYDHKQTTVTRRHQQMVCILLNSLITQGLAVENPTGVWDLGYTPADQTHWAPGPPATIGEALDRIVKLLWTLNGNVGP